MLKIIKRKGKLYPRGNLKKKQCLSSDKINRAIK